MPKLRIFRKHRSAEDELPSYKPRILFVSHEATRTGAPKIILNILKQFQYSCDVHCETILHEDGQLLDEFQCYSQVHSLYLPRQRSSELQKRIRAIVNCRKKDRPIVALCNSMESRFVVEQLSQAGITVIALVHELPCSYAESDYQLIYEHATKIVFPVKAVRDSSHRKLPIPFGKDLVLPQGLLDPHFADAMDHDAARRQIREELSLPTDAFIVLGCGTLDMRKGIDHFAAIAKSVVRKNHSTTAIHFVWVGDGPRWPHSAYHYVQIDLKNARIASHVHFIGERAQVAPYFFGSDMFLLPSRVDPFPCVVHEAMAARLPVMTFAESGGASEALENGGGFVVPYADYEMAAGIICGLAQNPAMADSMRATSFQRVQNEYRFDSYASDLISLTEALTGCKLRSRTNISIAHNCNGTIQINRAA